MGLSRSALGVCPSMKSAEEYQNSDGNKQQCIRFQLELSYTRRPFSQGFSARWPRHNHVMNQHQWSWHERRIAHIASRVFLSIPSPVLLVAQICYTLGFLSHSHLPHMSGSITREVIVSRASGNWSSSLRGSVENILRPIVTLKRRLSCSNASSAMLMIPRSVPRKLDRKSVV